MKTKLFNIILAALSIVFLMSHCNEAETQEEPVMVSEVKVSPDHAEVIAGTTLQLNAEVLPDNVMDKTVMWTSSDMNLASVDNNGLVTAFANKGTVTITAHAGEVTGRCEINIVGKPVSSVSLDKTELKLYKNETAVLTATVMPEDAEDKSLSWKSSDAGIATVDDAGTVTAKSIGETVVTVQAGNATAECKVIVEPKPAESVTLDKSELELLVGDTFKLTAVVMPEDADEKSVSWKSSDESVVKVASDGTVTALSEGQAEVSVNCGNLNDMCKVTVVSSKEISLGDYFYSDGTYSSFLDNSKTPIGLIFYLDADRKGGKIISLDESEEKFVDNKSGYADVYDKYDGLKNMEWVKQMSNWEEEYPAFSWCANKTDGGLVWYLPAIRETHQICAGMNGLEWVENGAEDGQVNDWPEGYTTMPYSDDPKCMAARESFSNKSLAAGKCAISFTDPYFSSTADNYDRNAYTIRYEDGMSLGEDKKSPLKVRAIAVFTLSE